MKRIQGFTLIELLIVVAIIAILAAIAIPNFLAAQVRSKVSKTLSEFRTMGTALESYYVDNNDYPGTRMPDRLTTPVAFITSLPKSPWLELYPGLSPDEVTVRLKTYYLVGRWGLLGTNPSDIQTDYLNYILNPAGYNDPEVLRWELKSIGPDGKDDINEWRSGNITRAYIYDPTNGTVSPGDIIWFNNEKGSAKGQ